jgi:hypothetical protein
MPHFAMVVKNASAWNNNTQLINLKLKDKKGISQIEDIMNHVYRKIQENSSRPEFEIKERRNNIITLFLLTFLTFWVLIHNPHKIDLKLVDPFLIFLF